VQRKWAPLGWNHSVKDTQEWTWRRQDTPMDMIYTLCVAACRRFVWLMYNHVHTCPGL